MARITKQQGSSLEPRMMTVTVLMLQLRKTPQLRMRSTRLRTIPARMSNIQCSSTESPPVRVTVLSNPTAAAADASASAASLPPLFREVVSCRSMWAFVACPLTQSQDVLKCCVSSQSQILPTGQHCPRCLSASHHVNDWSRFALHTHCPI